MKLIYLSNKGKAKESSFKLDIYHGKESYKFMKIKECYFKNMMYNIRGFSTVISNNLDESLTVSFEGNYSISEFINKVESLLNDNLTGNYTVEIESGSGLMKFSVDTGTIRISAEKYFGFSENKTGLSVVGDFPPDLNYKNRYLIVCSKELMRVSKNRSEHYNIVNDTIKNQVFRLNLDKPFGYSIWRSTELENLTFEIEKDFSGIDFQLYGSDHELIESEVSEDDTTFYLRLNLSR